MTRLKEIQHEFLAYLLNPGKQMTAYVLSDDNLTAAQRLEIYAEGYRLRLLEALQENYPALHTLLGDDEFKQVALTYINTQPSHHFSIRYFGDQLASLLETTPPYKDMPVLYEMAAFEWVLRDAFDAPDSKIIATTDLSSIKPEAWPCMKLVPHPALRRLDLSWNAPQLWLNIQNDVGPIPPEENPHPICWIVWREELQTFFRSLQASEAWAIDALFNGASFGELCEGLCEWIDELNAPSHAAGLITRWIEDGLITNLQTN